jgi:flagellin-specific chaperone FliS
MLKNLVVEKDRRVFLQTPVVNELDSLTETHFATINDIPIIGDKKEFIDAFILLLNNKVSECIKILQQNGFVSPFQNQTTVEQIAHFIIQYGIAKGFDKEQLIKFIKTPGKKGEDAVIVKVQDILEKMEAPHSQSRKLEESGKHKQGEHVINKDVVSVYQYIINQFTQEQFGKDLEFIPKTSQIYKDYHDAWSSHVKHNIEKVLIVVIDKLYIDTNASAYGETILMLREAAKLHMIDLYRNDEIEVTEYIHKIEYLVKSMNEYLIYVDKVALQIWLKPGRRRDKEIYEEALTEVKNMFIDLCKKVHEWVQDFKQHRPN